MPPGPKGLPIIGSLIPFFNNFLGFLEHMAKQYGDISYFKYLGRKCYVINRPDLIRDVLVTHNSNFLKARALERTKILLGNGILTSEKDFHLRHRRMIQPVFHKERIASFAQSMTEYANRHSCNWKDGKVIDMHKEMMNLTLAIVAKTLFNTDVESEADVVGESFTELMNQFPGLLMPYSELLDNMPLPSVIRFNKAKKKLDNLIFNMIGERRESSMGSFDLLSMLIETRDEESKGEVMSDQQVRDEAMTLLLAGHETTAVALTWTWYLLSQNPSVENKLHSELREVLNNRLPEFSDYENLTYTRMILTESMRIFPPVWAITRRVINHYKIDNYLVPSDSTIFMSQYVIQNDPRFFPEPGIFNPERWTHENVKEREKFTYFPFGGGPRLCIGEPFAWLEVVMVLATLASRWKARLVPKHKVELLPLITLRPKYGMKMILESN